MTRCWTRRCGPGANGSRFISATVPVALGDAGLSVHARQSAGSALALAIDNVRTTALVTAISLLLAGAAVVLSARTLLAPLERLAATARAVGTGDRTVDIDQAGRGEVGELARAMAAMVADLHRNMAALEREIAERVQAERALSELAQRAFNVRQRFLFRL